MTALARRSFVAFLLFLSVPVFAQTGNQGSLGGRVLDASGAAVPQTILTIRNLENSGTFQTATDDEGVFRFLVLPVGTYELILEHAGFNTLVIKRIEIVVGARITLASFVLSPANRVERVVVQSETPLVEPTRTQVSTTISERLIAGLPVNGRDFVSFVLLTPGVTTDARGGLSFGGQRAMNSLLVDGANNDGAFFGQPLGGDGFNLGNLAQSAYDISQDAVQEFQVNSNSYSAELGRAGGGVINAITRSGSNDFHGTAFWFYRDRALNANDAVNRLNHLPKSPFHFNQFGGVLGGPIYKHRLFFFASYDGLRSNVANPVFLRLPPGFQLNADPVIAGFQQLALDYLTARANSWSAPLVQNDLLVKLDAQVARAHQLSGRWIRQRITTGFDAINAQNAFEHTTTASTFADTLAVSLTSSFGTNKVNVARFHYIVSEGPFDPNGILPEALIQEGGQAVLMIGRASNRPQNIKSRGGQWTDTFTRHNGRHIWKFGVDVLLDWVTFFHAQNFSGTYRFQSLESFGRSLAGAPVPQLGEFFRQAFSGFGTPGSTTHPDSFQYAAFVQDEWHVRPGLTLNLGVRYDLHAMAKPPVRNPSLALSAASLDTSFLRTDKNNFAPRAGLAWSPFRGGRMVVRAGYGIYFAPTPAIMNSRAHFQNGVSVQTRTFNALTPAASLIPAYPNTICGPPDLSGAPPSCAAPPAGAGNSSLTLFSKDFVEPYTQQGSFGVEAELARDFSVSATYLVVRGTHLQRARDVNLGAPTPTSIGIAGTTTVLTFRRFPITRPIAGFDRIAVFESAGNSIYHGLALQVNRRFANRFQLLAAYTFSKVIDDNPNVYNVTPNPGPADLYDASNARGERSISVNDQRHRLVLSGIWELGYARNSARLARAVSRGWELSGILTAQSGQAYSGLVSFDLNNDGNGLNERTPGLGRNTFYLPAIVSLDLRLSRLVRVGEHIKVQMIGEAFNVLNRDNFSMVQSIQYARFASTSICTTAGTPCLVPQPGFGVPTATSGPRILQLALKLLF